MHVVVPVRQQHVPQRLEDARLIAAEIIRENQVQGSTGLRIVLVMPLRVLPSATTNHLLSCQTEEEEVLLARLCSHLNRRAVACADRQCAVHHELHVACPTGFVACRRDLVGDVTGRNEVLRKRGAVLGQEYNLQPPAYVWVAVDGRSKFVNKLEDPLREPIRGCSFACEKERPWVHVQPRVLP